jgi:hypothetical protein
MFILKPATLLLLSFYVQLFLLCPEREGANRSEMSEPFKASRGVQGTRKIDAPEPCSAPFTILRVLGGTSSQERPSGWQHE